MAEPEPITLEDLITIQKAAEMIGCAVGTVRRYLREGKLRLYKAGRGTRVSKREVELVFPIRPALVQLENLITVQQAAQLLSVRVDTLYRWVRDGKLRGFRIGLHSYVSKSALNELVSGMTANRSSVPGQFIKGGGKLPKGSRMGG